MLHTHKEVALIILPALKRIQTCQFSLPVIFQHTVVFR